MVVPNRLSAFGRYSYPVKLYEAMACGIPVLATATEPSKWILQNQAMFLANPDDPFDMVRKLKDVLLTRPDRLPRHRGLDDRRAKV